MARHLRSKESLLTKLARLTKCERKRNEELFQLRDIALSCDQCQGILPLHSFRFIELRGTQPSYGAQPPYEVVYNTGSGHLQCNECGFVRYFANDEHGDALIAGIEIFGIEQVFDTFDVEKEA